MMFFQDHYPEELSFQTVADTAKLVHAKRVGFTTGTYDMPHEHHFDLLKFMRGMCDFLIVGLTTDEQNKKQKRESIMLFPQRKKILESTRFVDTVIPNCGETKQKMYSQLKFDVLFIGRDYAGTREYSDFERQNPQVKVVYIPDLEEKQISKTSAQIRRLERRFLNSLRILNFGLGGPILQFEGDRQNVAIKPVRLGRREAACASDPGARTADVYNLGQPLPRNWKRLCAGPHRFPNVSGVNGFREIDIHARLEHKPWNPVLMVKEVASAPREEEAEPSLSPSADGFAAAIRERELPASIYWIYQKSLPKTLKDWLAEGVRTLRHHDLEQQQESPPSTSAFELQLTEILDRTAKIVAELRELKIVHGDLHSSNICLDEDLNVFLIDYGWCMSEHFNMNSEEKIYFSHCLSENFDLIHLRDSLEVDLPADLFESVVEPWFSTRLLSPPTATCAQSGTDVSDPAPRREEWAQQQVPPQDPVGGDFR